MEATYQLRGTQMKTSETVGKNLRAARLRRKISQQALADRCGMARPRISELESGHFNPTVNTVSRVATVLQIPISLLFRPAKKR